jgi:hypothetical protein
MAGVGGSARLWLTSLAKSAVMRATVKAGLAERLVRRRGRPPTDAERAALREVLAAARAADDLAQRA